MQEQSNKKQKMITGVIWSYAERFLAQAITLAVSVVLARILDPAHYGIIAIVTVFITICDAFVVGGFGNALIQKKDATETDFNSICWVSVTIALVLYALLFVCAPLIADFYSEQLLVPVIRVMGIKFIFSAYNSVQQAYIQRKLQFKKFFFATLTGTLLSAVVGIGMALAGFGVWALVAQYLTNTIIDTIFLFFSISWKPKLEISWKSVKELWAFGSKMLASTMVYTIKDNIRSLIVGKKFSSSDLAYYNQGKKYPQLLVTDIVDSIGKVIFPVLSEKQESRDDVVRVMRQSIQVSSFVLLPAILGLMATGDTFISLLLTDKWMPAVPYLRILCLVYLPRPMATIFQKGLLAIGNSNANLVHEAITSAVTIGMLIVASLVFNSVELIAWSYVIVAILGLLIFMYFVAHEFSYNFTNMISDYAPSLLLSVAMSVCVYFVGRIAIGSAVKLAIQVVAGLLIYISGAYIFRVKGFGYVMQILRTMKKTTRATK